MLRSGDVPRQFLCWNCNETTCVPPNTEPNTYTVPCEHCNIDNEVRVSTSPVNTMFMGSMPVVNRISQYF